jgi:hypothetical protein
LQFVPMTLLLLFTAVAHQRHVPRLREPLDQAKSELLSVILDGPAASIHRAVHEQFATVLSKKCRPGDLAGLAAPQESFARPK